MKQYLFAMLLAVLLLVGNAPAFAHGDGDDDDDHDHATMHIQNTVPIQADNPAAVVSPPMEIIPNWHPLFVHFTIALLLTATLLFVVWKFAPVTASWRPSLLYAARLNLYLGVLITFGTVMAGWYAFNTVNHDNHAHLPMLSHRLWALSTAGIYILLALWALIARRREPQTIFILCLVLASGALAITGFKGGELVYRHGLGVMSMPQMDDGYMHHHNAGSHSSIPQIPGMTTDTEHHNQ